MLVVKETLFQMMTHTYRLKYIERCVCIIENVTYVGHSFQS